MRVILDTDHVSLDQRGHPRVRARLQLIASDILFVNEMTGLEVRMEGIQIPFTIDSQAIAQFAQRWNVHELALFGSALRADFRPTSDIDVLVSFVDGSTWGVVARAQMRDELQALFGRPIDLVSRRGVERSCNWIRRAAILDSAQTIYHTEQQGATNDDAR